MGQVEKLEENLNLFLKNNEQKALERKTKNEDKEEQKE